MLQPFVTLLLLSIALAWSVFFRAGVPPGVWSVTLLIVGGVSFFHWLFARRIHRAPPLPRWLSALICLLPCYIVFQLVPFPVGVLQVLSPARAALVQALAPVVPGITSAPLSVNPPAAVLGLFTFLGYIATFLIIRDISWRFSMKPWTSAIPLIVIAVFEAGIGMSQVLTNWPWGQATGTYANHDHFAGLLEMVLPFAALYGFALLRHTKARLNSPVWPAIAVCATWGSAAILMVAIVYSVSRMGFLVSLCVLFIIAALAIGPRLPSRRWRWPAFAGIGAVIVLMLFLFPPDQLIRSFAELSATESVSAKTRTFIWKETLPLISEFRLFGCGLGGFEATFLKYQGIAANFRVNFAHNDYLQYLAELGIAGFAILAAILIGVLVQIFRGVAGRSDENRRLLVIACAGAFAGILLHSLVDFNMYIPANAMTLAWIAGIGSANALD